MHLIASSAERRTMYATKPFIVERASSYNHNTQARTHTHTETLVVSTTTSKRLPGRPTNKLCGCFDQLTSSVRG